MKETKSVAIAAAFSVLPYLLVAWAYMAFTDGHAKDFWVALCVLLVVRLFFFIIETIGGILAWRLYGRRVAVEKVLRFLRENNFPMRTDPNEDFLMYFQRIQEDRTCPESTRALARECDRELARLDGSGILPGMRADYAVQAALDRYTER